MILDYTYNKNKKVLSISYIKDDGQKALLNFNVNRFKSFYLTPSGRYKNWDGSACDIRYTEDPDMFDMKTYMKEIDPRYHKLLCGHTNPRLYTFDIEVEISDEFPEPSEAKFPITTISIANDRCDVIILGTRPLEDPTYLQKEYSDYMSRCEFFKTLGLPMPKIQYIPFQTEEAMLRYFLKTIVAKVPVLGGWNSIMFDWQYIQNRIKYYYPDLSFNSSSINWTMKSKNYTDFKNNKVRLSMPNHTLILDMMDVIGSFDYVVMPIKESLSLDYIAEASMGINKIKYNGSLQDLYESDYPKYVFYNAIDSVLVQLIDKKFKTLHNIYAQSIYCHEKIELCFSKIALAEALFFNYFYDHDIKIVPMSKDDRDRGVLVGAYVKQPIRGKHNYVCCNDFASLYPSTIISCNLSIENYMGSDFTEEELERYRKDPNYFVSVNGNVYKNDKDYAFRIIQQQLKDERSKSKYLSKQLDAMVMLDIEHMEKGRPLHKEPYKENIIRALESIGYDVKAPSDLKDIQDLAEFKRKLKNHIIYLSSYEQACKLLMNSCYGGSSHPYFAWYNIGLANDITGEARNLIHIMERHIPKYFDEHWYEMKDLHKKLGIKLKNR